MRRALWVVLVAVAVGGLAGWAAEDGFSGQIGADVEFLPALTTDLWLDLDWDLDGFGLCSLTEVSVLPAFVLSETLTASYALDGFRFRGVAGIDILPFAVGDLSLSVGTTVFDTGEDGFSFSADALFLVRVLPAFDLVLSLDLDAALGFLSLWGEFDFNILDLATAVLVGGEIQPLDVALEDGSLAGFLGAEATLIPAVDAWMWIDLLFRLGSVSVVSETQIALTPFGLTEQYFEVEVAFDGLTLHAWGGFTGDSVLFAGIGFTYDFP